ncbi:MAG: MBL fold metallo-hydrolase [Alphaproteobacteria bacterium]|nr:MBL fold metallo-hydrolase [Alphaproteobacteria bacterium]
MKLQVTVLGCGGSGGNPHIGEDWGQSDPANPRNRRRRASIHVQTPTTSILVDTSPDMRVQCLDAGIKSIDAVLYTHDHADHIHGVDDLRWPVHRRGRPCDGYARPDMWRRFKARFGYVFEEIEHYKPLLVAHDVAGPFQIGDLKVIPFEQDHGNVVSLGYRFGDLAYSTDLIRLPEPAFEALKGVRTWIVAALRFAPYHPTHALVEPVLEWIARVKPERAILTHMSGLLDYADLAKRLPPGVEPGWDGMTLDAEA